MRHGHRTKQMDKRAYLIRHICGTAIVTALFQATSFYCPSGTHGRFDAFLLWSLAAACCAFGVQVTWKSRRRRELWADVFAPSVIWATVSRIGTVPIPVICAALCVPVVHFLVPLRLYKDDAQKTLPLRTQMTLFLRRWRRALAGAVAAIVLYLGLSGFLSFPTVEPPRASDREQVTIETAVDDLTLLAPDCWSELNTRQKLSVLRIVADIEADVFGLPDRLTVTTEDLPGNTRAEYTDYKGTVTIDRQYLKGSTPDEALRSTLHECRHAYQHQLVALYESAEEGQKDLQIFRDADIPALKDSFDNYVDGDRDYDNYVRLRCEEDARDWASERSFAYFNAIRRHLAEAAAA